MQISPLASPSSSAICVEVRDGIMWRKPFIFYKGMKPLVGDAMNSCEVFQNKSDPVVFDEDVICAGSSLLMRSRPSAISWFIMPMNIYPIDRFSFRAFSHVIKKRLEAVHPFFTHRYSATAIMRVFRIVRVKTSRFRMMVGLESVCASPIDVMPMRDGPRGSSLFAKASTAFSNSTANIFQTKDSLPPTRTSKPPLSSPPLVRFPVDSSQPTVLFTGNIQSLSHSTPLCVVEPI